MTISLSILEQSVLHVFNVKQEDFHSKSRIKLIQDAKRLFCYQAVDYYGYTYQSVADHFGNDHSTIINHVFTARGYSENDKKFNREMEMVNETVSISKLSKIDITEMELIKFNLMLEQINETKEMLEKFILKLNTNKNEQ